MSYFILLNDSQGIKIVKRPLFGVTLQPTSVERGELLQETKREGFQFNYALYRDSNICLEIDENNVAPLTKEECLLLEAITYRQPMDRLDAFHKKLTWGVQLNTSQGPQVEVTNRKIFSDSTMLEETPVSKFRKGQRVIFHDNYGNKHYGLVRWTGDSVKFTCPVVGIETDDKISLHNYKFCIKAVGHLIDQVPADNALFLPESHVYEALQPAKLCISELEQTLRSRKAHGVLNAPRVESEDQKSKIAKPAPKVMEKSKKVLERKRSIKDQCRSRYLEDIPNSPPRRHMDFTRSYTLGRKETVKMKDEILTTSLSLHNRAEGPLTAGHFMASENFETKQDSDPKDTVTVLGDSCTPQLTTIEDDRVSEQRQSTPLSIHEQQGVNAEVLAVQPTGASKMDIYWSELPKRRKKKSKPLRTDSLHLKDPDAAPVPAQEDVKDKSVSVNLSASDSCTPQLTTFEDDTEQRTSMPLLTHEQQGVHAEALAVQPTGAPSKMDIPLPERPRSRKHLKDPDAAPIPAQDDVKDESVSVDLHASDSCTLQLTTSGDYTVSERRRSMSLSTHEQAKTLVVQPARETGAAPDISRKRSWSELPERPIPKPRKNKSPLHTDSLCLKIPDVASTPAQDHVNQPDDSVSVDQNASELQLAMQMVERYKQKISKMEEEAGRAEGKIQDLSERLQLQQEQIQSQESEIRTKSEAIRAEKDLIGEQIKVMENEILEKNKAMDEKNKVMVTVIATNYSEIKAKDDEIELKTLEILALKEDLKAKCDEIIAKDTTMHDEIGAKNDEIKAKEIEVAAIAEQARAQVERKNEQIADLHKFIVETEERDLTRRSWNIPRAQIESITKHEIGRGAWGVVYSATFRGESVAIKQAHKEILSSQTSNMLKREVEIMSDIHYPNLLKFIGAVFDDAVERGTEMPVIVFELMDMNLREAYTKIDLSNSLISIFCDVAYALHYLHQRREPIIHRDLSAPNVLLKVFETGRFIAKVSDFGSANMAKQAQTAGTGAIVYSAPEMFPNDDITAPPQLQTTKVDVFSYGILLLEVAVKDLPTPEKRYTLLQRVHQEWQPMYELIVHCTKPQPPDRPTMADILNKLNSVI